MNKRNLSIIIPTYNKYPRLKLTLASLTEVSGIEDTEVIIVNDGSTDETTLFLDKYNKDTHMDLKVLNVTNGGRSFARNIGVKNSNNERIIFCDDDMILDKEFINEHTKFLNLSDKNVIHGCIYSLPFLKFYYDPEKGIVFKEYKNLNSKSGLKKFCISSEDIKNKFIKIESQRRLSKFESDIHKLYVSEELMPDSKFTWVSSNGGNLSMHKELFLKAGSFDENMGKNWGAEDLELGYRLHKNGAHFCFAKNAINYHITHVRENTQEIHNIAFDYFKNKYKDEIVNTLYMYFNGGIKSLVDWKENITKS